MAAGDSFNARLVGTLRTFFNVGRAKFVATALTAPRTLTLPDLTGTLALTFQVPGVVTVTIGDGTNVPAVGTQCWVTVPFAATITKATLLADVSGSAVVNVWKAAYASYPPVVGNKITASAPPTLTAALKATDNVLTGWTLTVSAGDVLLFNLDSVTTCKRLVLVLELARI